MKTILRSLVLCPIVLGGLYLCGHARPADGQDRGRDESRDRDRDRGDRSDRDRGGDRGSDRGSDRGRGGFDPSEWYKRMDANGDGIIQPSEMSDRTRSFLERSKPPGIDLSQPIPIAKLIEAFNAARAADERSRSESGSSGGSASGSGSTPAAPPGIRGFGGVPLQPGPPGFNVPLTNSSKSGGSIEQRYSRQVIEYVDRMLADYDRNRDSILDAEEISRGRWQNDPRESDLNKDGKLDKNELLERIAKRIGNSGGSGSSSSGSSSGSSTSSGGGADEREKFKRYAESLVKQHDENKNGVLDRDEWSSVKSITKETDLNNDSVVTVEELTVKLTNDAKQASTPGSGGSSSSSGSAGGSPGGSSGGGRGGPPYRSYGSSRSGSGDAKVAEVRSYRQKSPLERLPKGLPDWFARNDADGDGQVVMAEYSTSWSESKATEFAKFDLNGDGVVTPAECLKAQELEKGSPSSSTTSAPSGSGFGRR